ncbi:carboxypeptidase-like regulatory domain-containing protein [Lewinella sp. IMCC34183]|uniref:carboxypeptidase-like regulatory domain-containing protein n=1 Tax=Lewinella sp. IMCC34183 TaxID=2248762 RepID=UPI000E253E25|nr:carboxypeptidase-like regulatory domain-containing protein [Lewinella sp. IMCC34183]
MPHQEIKTAIQNGHIDEAVSLLREVADRQGDARLQNEVSALSGRWERLKRDNRSGVLEGSEVTRQESQIVVVILAIVDTIPTGAPLREELEEKEEEIHRPSVEPAKVAGEVPRDGPAGSRMTSILIGAISAAAIILLIVFIPCPTSSQYEVFHVLLALAAGGLAGGLTGYITANPVSYVSAGGGLAVFALVFFAGPEEALAEGKCAERGPFDFALRLDPVKPGGNYPDFDPEEYLPQLWVGNDWVDGTVDDNLVVDWKNLSANLDGQRLAFRFKTTEGASWKAESDSVNVTSSTGQQLVLVPNGVLRLLRGRVLDYDLNPIPNATIAFEELDTISNDAGRFALPIPLDRQQKSYPLEVRASGYRVYMEEHFPHSTFTVKLEKE